MVSLLGVWVGQVDTWQYHASLTEDGVNHQVLVSEGGLSVDTGGEEAVWVPFGWYV